MELSTKEFFDKIYSGIYPPNVTIITNGVTERNQVLKWAHQAPSGYHFQISSTIDYTPKMFGEAHKHQAPSFNMKAPVFGISTKVMNYQTGLYDLQKKQMNKLDENFWGDIATMLAIPFVLPMISTVLSGASAGASVVGAEIVSGAVAVNEVAKIVVDAIPEQKDLDNLNPIKKLSDTVNESFGIIDESVEKSKEILGVPEITENLLQVNDAFLGDGELKDVKKVELTLSTNDNLKTLNNGEDKIIILLAVLSVLAFL